MCGAHSFRGRAGNPAPEPMSRTWGAKGSDSWDVAGRGLLSAFADKSVRATLFGKRWRARKKDSPKWRVTISSGWRMEVRLMRAFQRSNRSMYVDIWSRVDEGSDGSRNGSRRAAVRAVSTACRFTLVGFTLGALLLS